MIAIAVTIALAAAFLFKPAGMRHGAQAGRRRLRQWRVARLLVSKLRWMSAIITPR